MQGCQEAKQGNGVHEKTPTMSYSLLDVTYGNKHLLIFIFWILMATNNFGNKRS